VPGWVVSSSCNSYYVTTKAKGRTQRTRGREIQPRNMATSTEATIGPEEPTNTKAMLSPEPEMQRGRKRRRSPAPFVVVATAKTLSGESATLRGRRRHRSTSVLALSAFSSRNPSRSLRDPSASPSRKRFFVGFQLERRRSASPSRSRSPNATEPPPRRRRQRTRSRRRDHDNVTSFPAAEIEPQVQLDVVIGSQRRQEEGK
jgi:hypothetical protein